MNTGGHGRRCGCGPCRELRMEAYGRYYANDTRVPQVVWYNATVDAYGRSPLPEWNGKYARLPYLRVVKVIRPAVPS